MPGADRGKTATMPFCKYAGHRTTTLTAPRLNLCVSIRFRHASFGSIIATNIVRQPYTCQLLPIRLILLEYLRRR